MNDSAALPERIGDYRIERLLGEGAMGRVYLAQQREPAREVALKLLRSPFASGEMLHRFQREIEILARLEHPGIARVYDAGTVDLGGARVPYLAMEVVRGTDLVSHAQAAALDLPARIRLLAELARTVHYAHTRGVIHRDLKPRNILVGDDGRARILDFGVAHAVETGDATQMTLTGQVLGTVPYVSWEQMFGEVAGPDPRSDVYSLGIIAYELIGGRLPYPAAAQSSMAATLEHLRTHRPERLSRLEPGARGDLETVIGKAMAREPLQRYASAAEFAADLDNVLAQRPIQAQPPTAAYVLRLLLRRHRALAAAVAVTAGAIIASAVVSAGFALSEAAARRETEQRAAELQAVNRFTRQMFAAATPEQAQGRAVTALDVLDAARRTLAAEAAQLPPRVLGQLQHDLGASYGALGEYDHSRALLEQALQQAPAAFGDRAIETATLRLSLARTLDATSRWDEAAAALQPLLDDTLPASPEWQRLQIEARVILAHGQFYRGQQQPARAALRAAITEATRSFGADDELTLTAMGRLFIVLHSLKEYAEAGTLGRALLAAHQARHGADHPKTLAIRLKLAALEREQNRLAEAEALLRALLADSQRVLGPDHLDTMMVLGTLTTTLNLRGKFREAQPLAEQALAGWSRYKSADSLSVLFALRDLADVQQGLGDPAQALRTRAEIIRRVEASGRELHPGELIYYAEHAMALADDGQLPKAKRMLESLLERARKTAGEDRRYAHYASDYGEVLRRLGDRAGARRYLEQALPILRAAYGDDDRRTRAARQRLQPLDTAGD